jgi:hypothetical protein
MFSDNQEQESMHTQMFSYHSGSGSMLFASLTSSGSLAHMRRQHSWVCADSAHLSRLEPVTIGNDMICKAGKDGQDFSRQ